METANPAAAENMKCRYGDARVLMKSGLFESDPVCAAAAGLRLDQRRGSAAPAAVRSRPHLGGPPGAPRPPAASGLHGCSHAPLSPRCQRDFLVFLLHLHDITPVC